MQPPGSWRAGPSEFLILPENTRPAALRLSPRPVSGPGPICQVPLQQSLHSGSSGANFATGGPSAAAFRALARLEWLHLMSNTESINLLQVIFHKTNILLTKDLGIHMRKNGFWTVDSCWRNLKIHLIIFWRKDRPCHAGPYFTTMTLDK